MIRWFSRFFYKDFLDKIESLERDLKKAESDNLLFVNEINRLYAENQSLKDKNEELKRIMK